MTTETSKLYVDIQSLLDLRQAALIDLVGEDKASEVVASDAYNFREQDSFPDLVDTETFRNRLTLSDPSLLRKATVTYIEVVLKSKIANLEKRNAFYGVTQKPELILNVYPYRFTEQEIRVLQNAVFIKMDCSCIVTIVRDDPKVWSPSYIKHNNVIAFFMYDVSVWMNAHASKATHGDLRDALLYFPALGYQELTKEEQKKITKLGFRDIFSYTEFLMSTSMQLSFLPVVFYTNIITATAHMDKYAKTLTNKSVQEVAKEA